MLFNNRWIGFECLDFTFLIFCCTSVRNLLFFKGMKDLLDNLFLCSWCLSPDLSRESQEEPSFQYLQEVSGWSKSLPLTSRQVFEVFYSSNIAVVLKISPNPLELYVLLFNSFVLSQTQTWVCHLNLACESSPLLHDHGHILSGNWQQNVIFNMCFLKLCMPLNIILHKLCHSKDYFYEIQHRAMNTECGHDPKSVKFGSHF